MLKLDEKKWNSFSLESVFTVEAGKRLETRNKNDGLRPFIGATDNGNGITGFVSNDNDSKDHNVLGVNYNGAPCIAFYHPYECIFTDDVKRLHLKNWIDNEDSLLSFIPIFTMQRSKYSYGYKFKERRMLRQKLMLPVTENDEPDYDYMEKYVAAMREMKLTQYREYVKKRIDELGDYVEIPTLDEREWKPFLMDRLFNSLIPGKISNASRLTRDDTGSIEYIAATNRNNGVAYFLKKDENSLKKLQDGNCIGFIKDGNGSAGYAIYKQEPFASTVNVIYGYAEWLNKYSGLFFVAAQDKIENKYSHGYKRNKEHLKGDRIMLPVDNKGKPDYAYMEQYSKNMMLRKYKQYLNYLNKQTSDISYEN